jgi:hypothetical protein
MQLENTSVFYWQKVIFFKLIFYIVAHRKCLLKHVIEGNNGKMRKKMYGATGRP